MYHLIEADTWRGIRRFLIAAGTGREAAQEMASLIESGGRPMDESGEWVNAIEIDPSSMEARGVQPPPLRPSRPLHERRAEDDLRPARPAPRSDALTF